MHRKSEVSELSIWASAAGVAQVSARMDRSRLSIGESLPCNNNNNNNKYYEIV